MLKRIVAVLVVLVMPLAAGAQPLSDKVPADAMLYFGWQGSEGMPSSYQNSHLKALLDSSNIPQVFSQMVPRLIQRVSLEDREAAEHLKNVIAIGGPLWRRPWAIYFGGVDFAAAAGPQPRFALLCDAGPEAQSLLDQLAKLDGG